MAMLCQRKYGIISRMKIKQHEALPAARSLALRRASCARRGIEAYQRNEKRQKRGKQAAAALKRHRITLLALKCWGMKISAIEAKMKAVKYENIWRRSNIDAINGEESWLKQKKMMTYRINGAQKGNRQAKEMWKKLRKWRREEKTVRKRRSNAIGGISAALAAAA